MDPDAMDALTKMGTYLRTLKAFQVDADITSDDVLDDGQIITKTRKTTVLAAGRNMPRAQHSRPARSAKGFRRDGKDSPPLASTSDSAKIVSA